MEESLHKFLEAPSFERIERLDKSVGSGWTIPWYEARAHSEWRKDLCVCGYGETAADAIEDCRHKLRLMDQWTSSA